MSFIRELMTLLLPGGRFRQIRELVRRYPRQAAVFSVATLVLYVGVILFAVNMDKRDRERQRSKNLSYDSQLANLKQTETSLQSLLAYIEDQKTKLKESEDLINGLKVEKQRLEPLVKADRDVVNAVFDIQTQRAQKDRWLGHAASFGLGVLSSLAATLIAYSIKVSRWRGEQQRDELLLAQQGAGPNEEEREQKGSVNENVI